MPTWAEDVATEIRRGLVSEEDMDLIVRAISDGRERLAARKIREIRPGDVVRFVKLGMGAKYMNGHTAIVESINWKTVWVRLTPDSKAALSGTRFGRSSKIKVYPNNIELAFITGTSSEPPPKLKAVNPDWDSPAGAGEDVEAYRG